MTRELLWAGRAVFTVRNPSGGSYTYQVRDKVFPGRLLPTYFVYLLTGPNNLHDFTYLGIVDRPGTLVTSVPTLRCTAKSPFPRDARVVRVFDFAMRLLYGAQVAPPGYLVQAATTCARCGRRLTTPDSIDRGIGPECAGLL